MTSSAATYHQYGTWTGLFVAGHQNDIGAVAISRTKCAATPQAAPERMSSTVAGRDLPDRATKNRAKAQASTRLITTHRAWVYGRGVPLVKPLMPNSAGR